MCRRRIRFGRRGDRRKTTLQIARELGAGHTVVTDTTTIENGPMQIILDVMVDNTWQRSWNKGLLDSTLVRDLGVDYIRVFQLH